MSTDPPRDRGLEVSQPVESHADVDPVRRLAATVADAERLGESQRERVAAVATGMTTALLRCGPAGRILVRPWEENEARGVELVGTVDPIASNSPHTGYDASLCNSRDSDEVDAIAGAADFFDAYSAPGVGTVMAARVWAGDPTAAQDPQFLVGSMTEAFPGELACGDGCAVGQQGPRVVVLVADGLGHGTSAQHASTAAVAAFRSHQAKPVETIAGEIHRALTRTRGAAIGVVEVDRRSGRIRFCGIGNIAMRLVTGRRHKALVSQYGIAGYQDPSIRAFEHAWEEGALLVMHSDGLSNAWDLDAYEGLERHHPQLVAATVMRDAARAHDDALVLALRGTEESDRTGSRTQRDVRR